ncbi:MAG: SDR family oxidoreductase [Oscillospiraceae bacterium]|nr:SDR family oxidoreductase [Oscillospiraceae bacterium]
MTALITGASSGIGRDIARLLAEKGVRLIISGRNTEKLEELRQEIGERRVKVIAADISDREECRRLYREASKYDVDILVNNAGFGLYGRFANTDLETELEMIDVNIGAVHILTKLFLADFVRKDKGYILNVASSAGFMPGVLMSTYYSSKNYVVRLTEAIREELRSSGSNVYIGAFCPGPVDTNFNDTAGVKFALDGISSEYAAKCAVEGMLKRKTLIIPTLAMKAAVYGSKLMPDMALARIVRHFQSKKGEKN